MSSPEVPGDRDVLDQVWAEFGPPQTGPVTESGSTAPSNGSPAATVARQAAGYLLLVTTVGAGHYLLISRPNAAGLNLPVIVSGVVAALGGAAAGFLLATRYPLSGMLAGACSGVGSVWAAVWALGRLTPPDPAVVGMVALAGLALGAVTYHPLCWLQVLLPQPQPTPTGRTLRPSGPLLAVIDGPPPEPSDPKTVPLEERLMHLCKQDRRLFDRLLSYERTRHPGQPRGELLRLAIQHFDRDNR